MKLASWMDEYAARKPRPVRGAWVETPMLKLRGRGKTEPRPVRGAWVETGNISKSICWGGSRAPYGARGLKRVQPI